MSLDTLLEAAKYLDHIQKSDCSDGQTWDYCERNEYIGSEEVILPSSTYHLKVDPNIPISVQFHTYTSNGSSIETISQMATSRAMATNANISTKRNGHQNGGHVMNESNLRSSMNTSNGVNNKIKDHSAYSRHREMHKTLEKNRRAHLRQCFEVLKEELPLNEYNEKKSSHINIISCAIRYIQHLKRIESELHQQTERLMRTKHRFQNQIAQLRQDLMDGHQSGFTHNNLFLSDNYLDFEPQVEEQSDEEVIIEFETGEDCYDDETTTTASECADDLREPDSPSKISRPLANPLIYKCHA
ncbi:max dimerization protein 1-like [Oppia nitens]|uniref:max dimerization protein 1-like n=1 Tax=Oppia nitens TaxID=1686743 RepID=UPI0023D9A1BC|nr:max dimerization protein 1-like [Oppia nitens]